LSNSNKLNSIFGKFSPGIKLNIDNINSHITHGK